MFCVLAVYPNRPGSRFDFDYYRTKHVHLALSLLKPFGFRGIRISGASTALDGAPPSVWAVGEMRFASRDDFDKAMAANGAALFADAAHYTDVEPMLQVSGEGEEFA